MLFLLRFDLFLFDIDDCFCPQILLRLAGPFMRKESLDEEENYGQANAV